MHCGIVNKHTYIHNTAYEDKAKFILFPAPVNEWIVASVFGKLFSYSVYIHVYCFEKQKCVLGSCGDKKDDNPTTCKPDEMS